MAELGARRPRPRGGAAGGAQSVAVVRTPGHRPALRLVPGAATTACAGTSSTVTLAAGIHTGTCKDAPGGFADYFPAHDSMLIPVPDAVPDELAVFADPFAVSLHSVTRHPPPPGGKVARLRGRRAGHHGHGHPAGAASRRRGHGGGPLRRPGRPGPAARGHRGRPRPGRDSPDRRRRRRGPGGVLHPARQRPAHGPSRRHRRRLRHHREARDLRGRRAAAQAAGDAGEERRARPRSLGVVAAVLQGDLVGGLERLRRRGGRRRPHARHRPLPEAGGGGPGRPDRHAHPHLPSRPVARGLLASWPPRSESGAIKVAFDFR